MTGYDIYRIGVDVVTLAVIPTGLLIGRLLNTIKNNDLHHIDANLRDIKIAVKEVDDKLERHLEWHINRNA